MFKKIGLFFISFLFIVALPLNGDYYKHKDFLSDAIDVGANVVKEAGTDFITWEPDFDPLNTVALTVEFTRAAGTSSTVDFEFEVSFDGGDTWALFRDSLSNPLIRIPTNTTVISGTTVRVTFQVNVYGYSDIRLKSIDNNDTLNGITAVMVTLSYGKR